MEQKQIVDGKDLLNEDGTLSDFGYSKTPILNYNKGNVKKKKRIKEWDYYYISDSRFGLCLTISNLSYVGAISASVIDFRDRRHYNKTSLILSPKGKVILPESSKEGLSVLRTKDAEFRFEVKDGKRFLTGIYNNFYKDNGQNRNLEFEIEIFNEPQESMVKVTPFKNKYHFYYNQKINCMTAQGKFNFKGKTYVFDPEHTMATLDWGRGVLPYNTLWYWASMQAKDEHGKTLGINLGKALGNNSHATENMIFYDGKAHKLGDVKIYIQRDKRKRDYMGTWTFYSDDGRLELMFVPEMDRYVPFNLLFLAFVPHQVFGKYSGKLILDDGKTIEIENLPGFAERVVNRW